MTCWRPRRDLNPCYRRERASMARNLLKTEDTDGSQRTSEDISELLIGRQLDAFSKAAGADAPFGSSMILKASVGNSVWPLQGVMIESMSSFTRKSANNLGNRKGNRVGFNPTLLPEVLMRTT